MQLIKNKKFITSVLFSNTVLSASVSYNQEETEPEARVSLKLHYFLDGQLMMFEPSMKLNCLILPFPLPHFIRSLMVV